MPRPPDAEAVYEAAERWVDAALRIDDSLFTPGVAIWAAPVIDDLYHRFVEQPDVAFADARSTAATGAWPSPTSTAG
jgi:hypothetical protein